MKMGNRGGITAEDPPHSRLFVVFNRKDPVSESELRNDFTPYGTIQSVTVIKDKATGEDKGVAYIKFSKMSEAVLALEKMNAKKINGHDGTYKVYIAKSRDEPRVEGDDDPNRFLRLFFSVGKCFTEDDVSEHFRKFGDIDYVKLIKNKETGESKGIGYVKFYRMYDAALALEDRVNDYSIKPYVARPKDTPRFPAGPQHQQQLQMNKHLLQQQTDLTFLPTDNHHRHTESYMLPSYAERSVDENFLHASVSSKLSKENIFRIFDIAPGLRNVKIISHDLKRLEIMATYSSTLAAEYALNKLQGLEYPFGEYINISTKKLITNEMRPNHDVMNVFPGKRDYRGEPVVTAKSAAAAPTASGTNASPAIDSHLTSALTKVLSDATALLKSAGLPTAEFDALTAATEDTEPNWSYSSYCDIPLPPAQKVVPKSEYDESTGMRLFIVGQPTAPPIEAIYDVFARFGNFAGGHIFSRKNYGFLYYTTTASGLKAIEIMCNKNIAGVNIKVMKAEPKKESNSKRVKFDL